MRARLELLDLPFTFTQQKPLTAHRFTREARDRGVELTHTQLEGLHRVGLLKPLFRVRRDGRLIAQLARKDEPLAWHLAHAETSARLDLTEASRENRLIDTSSEGFIARRRLTRKAGEIEYAASEYVYSAWQLMILPTVRPALSHMRYRGRREETHVIGLDVNRFWRAFALSFARWLDDLLVPLTALEPIYYPRIVGTLSVGSDEEFDRYQRWRRRLRLTETLRWLDLNAEWIKQAGAALLRRADSIDPLGDWLDLVREADPDRWTRLKGTARSAMDIRIAAEVLLRYYDHLAAGRRARPLEQSNGRWRGEFDSRLKPRRGLEGVLTEYGLSPHPSLVLVVEGATELLLFPRLMEHAGIRTDDDFITIQNAEGVGTDLGPLIVYAVAPRGKDDESGRYLRLQRPLTRILIVTDAEGPMTTETQRRERRDVWVERMLRTLPREHRTPAVRESLQRLVYVDTWTRRGLSFEFAHFTDRELARAIARLDRRQRQPSFQARVEQLARIRASRGNVDKALPRTSKVALAGELWPVLLLKIRRAERRKTEERIPVVRILDRATDLARELPRRNMVIGL